jgi:hypothetical protein
MLGKNTKRGKSLHTDVVIRKNNIREDVHKAGHTFFETISSIVNTNSQTHYVFDIYKCDNIARQRSNAIVKRHMTRDNISMLY